MAFLKAQDILLCELCETDPKITWKCVDCQLLMCDKCRSRIHPKFKNAAEHQIIALKQVGRHDDVKLDFNGIECKHHSGQKCCLFCESCDKVVCRKCLADAHRGHKCIEIKKAYDSKLDKLKAIKTRSENDKKGFIDTMQEWDKLKAMEESKCERIVREIQNQRDVLKEAVDENAEILITAAENKLMEVQDNISGEKIKVQRSINQLEDQTTKISSTIESINICQFFENVDQIEKAMAEIPLSVNLTVATMPKFIPSQSSEICFGLLQDDFPKDKPNSKVQIKMNKEISTQMKHILYLSVCQDNLIWVGDSLSNVLHKVKLDGSKVKLISTVNTTLRDISVTPSDDLLFSDAGTKLKSINAKTGKQANSIYSVAPLLVMHVHVSHDEKIIVSAITDNEGRSLYPATGRRVVIVMDKTGKQQALHEYDGNNKRLFTYPRYLSSTRTGNIGVVDTLSGDIRGRIVVLQDGDITNIYTGHPDTNTTANPFQPETITATPSDNFIVADMNRHALHILDRIGCLISVCNTKEHGIIYPNSLSYAPTGQLYVGCSPPVNSSEKAKLFEIVLYGC